MVYIRAWAAGGREVDVHYLPWTQGTPPPWGLPLAQLRGMMSGMSEWQAIEASTVAEPKWLMEYVGDSSQVGC